MSTRGWLRIWGFTSELLLFPFRKHKPLFIYFTCFSVNDSNRILDLLFASVTAVITLYLQSIRVAQVVTDCDTSIRTKDFLCVAAQHFFMF